VEDWDIIRLATTELFGIILLITKDTTMMTLLIFDKQNEVLGNEHKVTLREIARSLGSKRMNDWINNIIDELGHGTSRKTAKRTIGERGMKGRVDAQTNVQRKYVPRML
jgi:hypothetical protein